MSRPIAYIAWNHSGSSDAAERDTASLRAIPGQLTTTVGSSPYLDVQTAHDLEFDADGNLVDLLTVSAGMAPTH